MLDIELSTNNCYQRRKRFKVSEKYLKMIESLKYYGEILQFQCDIYNDDCGGKTDIIGIADWLNDNVFYDQRFVYKYFNVGFMKKQKCTHIVDDCWTY